MVVKSTCYFFMVIGVIIKMVSSSAIPDGQERLVKKTGLLSTVTFAASCGDLINGIGLVPVAAVDWEVDRKPQDSNGDTTPGSSTSLLKDAPCAGLLVDPYTFRHKGLFSTFDDKADPQAELEQCIHLGVDGYFTDFAFCQGFEGIAISPDGQTLYLLLKGMVFRDPATSLRIYQFDVQLKQYKGLFGYYRLEDPDHAIGDFTTVNQNEYLVIERDNNQGSTAKFKKIFKVDLSQKDADGFVAKEEVVDLLHLDGDSNNKLTFPFQTIEDILVFDAKTLLVANENNHPLAIVRSPAVDNKEFLILELDEPLPLALN